METNNGKRILPYVLLVIFVALFGYGLGAATIYVTEGKAALLGSGGNGTGAGGATGNTGQGGLGSPSGAIDQQPAGLDDQMKPFWSTFNAVEGEFYNRPLDRQQAIYVATKGFMQTLG